MLVRKIARPWRRLSLVWLGGLLGLLVTASPSPAAEKLIITLGLLQRTIAIDDLEQFVTTGKLTPQLAVYRQQFQLSNDQLDQIREVLNTPADLGPVAVAQFLYTEQGVLLLDQQPLESRPLAAPARWPHRRGSARRGQSAPA
ncbi:MAG: alpha/beta hydrolase, partial [Cyanobacteria bacterium J06638_6]